MSADRVVIVRRVLPATPDIVYDEWLDPVGMTEWMCPRSSWTWSWNAAWTPDRLDRPDSGSPAIGGSSAAMIVP